MSDHYFPRQLDDKLLAWSNLERPKPLVLRGPRQVGKSTLVRQLGLSYDHYLELNLERSNEQGLFTGLPPVGEFLQTLFLRHRLSPKREARILLFIDEIQQVPEAIQYLRYLYEDQQWVHVIAAGSLLEFSLGNVKSMPVGRVEFLSVYPLSFLEYLEWTDQTALADALKQVPVPDYAHDVLTLEFRRYALGGGMPEIVKKLAAGATPHELSKDYESIWDSYRIDLERHARSNSQREVLRFLLANAPYEHDRFAYANFGGSTYRSREVKEALQLLEQARILSIVRPTTVTQLPMLANTKSRPRLQFFDTGLLNYATGLHQEVVRLSELSSVYRGRLALHVVTQELVASSSSKGFEPYFWVRDKPQSSAEVDLLVRHRGELIGLEVKSGPAGRLRSLYQFVERSQTRVALRLLDHAPRRESITTTSGYAFRLVNAPLYAASQANRYLDWGGE